MAQANSPNRNPSLVERGLPVLAFPVTMGCALTATWLGFAVFDVPHTAAAALAVFIFGFILIPVMERVLPYRENWNQGDDDTRTDIIHLLISNGLVASLEKTLLVAALVGMTRYPIADESRQKQ